MSDTCTLKFGRRRVFLIGAEIVVFAGLMMISFCREMAGQEYGGKAELLINNTDLGVG